MDNIRKNLRETGWEEVEWINLAQWRAHVTTVINLLVP